MMPGKRKGDDEYRVALGHELVIAAKNNETDNALVLIEIIQGPNIDCKDGEGRTALHWAVAHNNAGLVTALVEKGADPTTTMEPSHRMGGEFDKLPKHARLPIVLASLRKHWPIVSAIAQSEKGQENPEEAGYGLALINASYYGQTKIATDLISRGAPVTGHWPSGYKNTALHFALRQKNKAINEAITKALVLAGADVVVENNQGESPLGMARRMGHKFLKIIVDNIPARDGKLQDQLLIALGEQLVIAAKNDETGNALVLIEKIQGPNIDYIDVWGSTALEWAMDHNNAGLVTALVEKVVDPTTLGQQLVTAARIHSIDSALFLIEKIQGPNIDYIDNWGLTALHWAVAQNNVVLVSALIAKGADPTTTMEFSHGMGEDVYKLPENARLPIVVASLRKHWPIVSAIAQSEKGQENPKEAGYGLALINASYYGQTKIATDLINRGAPVTGHWPTKYKNTALHFALRIKNRAITEALVLAGADVVVNDSREESPLGMARLRGYEFLAMFTKLGEERLSRKEILNFFYKEIVLHVGPGLVLDLDVMNRILNLLGLPELRPEPGPGPEPGPEPEPEPELLNSRQESFKRHIQLLMEISLRRMSKPDSKSEARLLIDSDDRFRGVFNKYKGITESTSTFSCGQEMGCFVKKITEEVGLSEGSPLFPYHLKESLIDFLDPKQKSGRRQELEPKQEPEPEQEPKKFDPVFYCFVCAIVQSAKGFSISDNDKKVVRNYLEKHKAFVSTLISQFKMIYDLSRSPQFETKWWVPFRVTDGFFAGKKEMSCYEVLSAILEHAGKNPESHTAMCFNLVMSDSSNEEKAGMVNEFLNRRATGGVRDQTEGIKGELDSFDKILEEQNKAATRIQSLFRGHRARTALEEQNKAATRIQSLFRDHRARTALEEQNKAATRFQSLFRGHRARTASGVSAALEP